MAIRTRKNVFTLIDAQGEWHPDLLWYARAIAEMKKRPIADRHHAFRAGRGRRGLRRRERRVACPE